MSAFKKSKKHLAILGIRIASKQEIPEFLQNFQLTVNRIQITCVILLFGTYISTTFCTLIFKANGFAEMSEALTYSIIGIVHSSFLSISIWKRPQIMAFMDDFDDAIKKSVFENFMKNLPFWKTFKTRLDFFRGRKLSGSHHLQAIDWNGRYVLEFNLEDNNYTKLPLYHSCCNNLVLQLFCAWQNGTVIPIAHSIGVSECLMIIIQAKKSFVHIFSFWGCRGIGKIQRDILEQFYYKLCGWLWLC